MLQPAATAQTPTILPAWDPKPCHTFRKSGWDSQQLPHIGPDWVLLVSSGKKMTKVNWAWQPVEHRAARVVGVWSLVPKSPSYTVHWVQSRTKKLKEACCQIEGEAFVTEDSWLQPDFRDSSDPCFCIGNNWLISSTCVMFLWILHMKFWAWTGSLTWLGSLNSDFGFLSCWKPNHSSRLAFSEAFVLIYDPPSFAVICLLLK